MNKIAKVLLKIAKELEAVRILARSREMYLPKREEGVDVREITPKGTKLVIYKYEKDNGDWIGVAFNGRSNKPVWYEKFRGEVNLERKIKDTAKIFREQEDEKRKRREFKHNYQVGDILYSSWGYDQTNVDFYEVVGIKEKSVVIREIAQKVVGEGTGSLYVMPIPHRFEGGKMTKRVSTGEVVKITSYAYAYRWKGKKKSITAPGYGH